MATGSQHGASTPTHIIAPPPSANASKSFLTTLAQIHTVLSRTSHSEAALRDDAWPCILKKIHGALDTGKPITGAGRGRGLPMSVVVQTLKAAWHVDGTWPVGPNAKEVMEEQAKERAKGDKGPVAKQDPDPEDVAKRYRERGVDVQDASLVEDDW